MITSINWMKYSNKLFTPYISREIIRILIIILFVFTIGQNLIGYFYLNWAVLKSINVYFFHSNVSKVDISLSILQYIPINSSNSIRNSVGNIALQIGDYKLAHKMLDHDILSKDWFIKRNKIIALSQNNYHETVLDEVRKFPNNFLDEYDPYARDTLLRDSIAFSAWSLFTKQDITMEERIKLLNIALLARPYDLASNIERWKINRDQQSEIALRYFDRRALIFNDPRLLDINIEKVSELVNYGFWTEEMTIRVFSYWIMAYPNNKKIDRQLKNLSNNNRNNLYWKLLQAEISLRKGDLIAAKQQYSQIAYNNYPFAFLIIGKICEISPNVCKTNENCLNYQKYNYIVPNNIIGEKHLNECKDTKNSIDSKSIYKDDLLDRISSIIELPHESTMLGENLLPPFDIKNYKYFNKKIYWKLAYTDSNQNFDKGGFIVSNDPLEIINGQMNAVIIGLWHGIHLQNRTPSMNGYQLWDHQINKPYSITIHAEEVYLLRVLYRTDSVPPVKGKVLFINFGSSIPELQLSTSDNEWKLITALLCNSSNQPINIPSIIVRSSLLGRVWIGDIELRKIHIDSKYKPHCNIMEFIP